MWLNGFCIFVSSVHAQAKLALIYMSMIDSSLSIGFARMFSIAINGEPLAASSVAPQRKRWGETQLSFHFMCVRGYYAMLLILLTMIQTRRCTLGFFYRGIPIGISIKDVCCHWCLQQMHLGLPLRLRCHHSLCFRLGVARAFARSKNPTRPNPTPPA